MVCFEVWLWEEQEVIHWRQNKTKHRINVDGSRARHTQILTMGLGLLSAEPRGRISEVPRLHPRAQGWLTCHSSTTAGDWCTTSMSNLYSNPFLPLKQFYLTMMKYTHAHLEYNECGSTFCSSSCWQLSHVFCTSEAKSVHTVCPKSPKVCATGWRPGLLLVFQQIPSGRGSPTKSWNVYFNSQFHKVFDSFGHHKCEICQKMQAD